LGESIDPAPGIADESAPLCGRVADTPKDAAFIHIFERFRVIVLLLRPPASLNTAWGLGIGGQNRWDTCL